MTGAAADARTRGGFLKTVAAGAAAATTVRIAGAAPARAGLSAAQDAKIIRFALLLEQFKASLYGEAVDRGRLRGELAEFARTAAEHERQHVRALARAIGGTGRAPRYKFGREIIDPHAFTVAAIALEEAAVGIYNGQAANLRRPALALALKIVSVEGRHAAWIRSLAGREPAPRAADPGEAVAAVLATMKRIQRG